MSHLNSIITAPVGIDDVRAVLATDCRSLGELCTHPDINPWSRYKPVRDPRPAVRLTATTAGRPNNAVTQPAMGSAARPNATGTYGLDIVAHTIGQLSDADATAGDWAYLRPSGMRAIDGTALAADLVATAATPFRLGDFENYFHGAVSPFGSALTVPPAIPNELNSSFTVALARTLRPITTDPGTAGSLTAAELSTGLYAPGSTAPLTFADLHFGAAAFPCDASGSDVGQWPVWVASAPATGGRSVDGQLNTPALAIGDHLAIIPFYSNKEITAANAYDADTYYFTIPDIGRAIVRVGTYMDSRGISLAITGTVGQTAPSGTTTVTYKVTVTVESTGSAEIFRNNIFNLLDATGRIIAQYDPGDIAVAAGSSWTHRGTFTVAATTAPRALEVRLATATFIRSALLLRHAD